MKRIGLLSLALATAVTMACNDNARTDNAAATDRLFVVTLSRKPNQTEVNAVMAQLSQSSSREEVFRDLLWALLNAKEFSFNH